MAYKFLKMVVLQKILKYVVEYYEKRFFGIFVFQQCLLFFLFALFLFYDHFPSSVRVEPVATKGYIFFAKCAPISATTTWKALRFNANSKINDEEGSVLTVTCF